jgi:hypothetical protein
MKKLIRHILIPVTGGTVIYIIFLPLSLLYIENIIIRTILAELLRGLGTIILGVAFNVGAAISSIYVNINCYTTQDFISGFLSILMIVSAHLILGVLWNRYLWKGGIAAIFLSGLWAVSVFNTQLWMLPSIGFVLAGVFLLQRYIFSVPAPELAGGEA